MTRTSLLPKKANSEPGLLETAPDMRWASLTAIAGVEKRNLADPPRASFAVFPRALGQNRADE